MCHHDIVERTVADRGIADDAKTHASTRRRENTVVHRDVLAHPVAFPDTVDVAAHRDAIIARVNGAIADLNVATTIGIDAVAIRSQSIVLNGAAMNSDAVTAEWPDGPIRRIDDVNVANQNVLTTIEADQLARSPTWNAIIRI